MTSLGGYVDAAIVVGVAIFTFVTGRSLVMSLIAEVKDIHEHWDDPSYEEYENGLSGDDIGDEYEEISDAYNAGEIDEDEAAALFDEYYS